MDYHKLLMHDPSVNTTRAHQRVNIRMQIAPKSTTTLPRYSGPEFVDKGNSSGHILSGAGARVNVNLHAAPGTVQGCFTA